MGQLADVFLQEKERPLHHVWHTFHVCARAFVCVRVCVCTRDIHDCIFVSLWHCIVELKINVFVTNPATQREN